MCQSLIDLFSHQEDCILDISSTQGTHCNFPGVKITLVRESNFDYLEWSNFVRVDLTPFLVLRLTRLAGVNRYTELHVNVVQPSVIQGNLA